MPSFDGPIAAVYLDVDLADSTRTCLRYLWARLSPGGLLVSQDGDFPLVTAVFADPDFWREEVGVAIPTINGLGMGKMLTIMKHSSSSLTESPPQGWTSTATHPAQALSSNTASLSRCTSHQPASSAALETSAASGGSRIASAP